MTGLYALKIGARATKQVPEAHRYEINGGLAGRVSHLQRVYARTHRSRALRALQAVVAPLQGLHRCEQPSSWYVRGTYGGGLGIFTGTWLEGIRYGGLWWYPSRPWLATPAMQVAVAHLIRIKHGGSWRCCWGGAGCAGLP